MSTFFQIGHLLRYEPPGLLGDTAAVDPDGAEAALHLRVQVERPHAPQAAPHL